MPTTTDTPVIVRDKWGTRTLVIQPGPAAWVTGTPENYAKHILEIEALTRTRLKDGEDPLWFDRVHWGYKQESTSGGASFAEFCARVHSDEIDTDMDALGPGDGVKEGKPTLTKGTAQAKRRLADELGVTRWDEIEVKVVATGIYIRKTGTEDFGNMRSWGVLGMKGKLKEIALLIQIAKHKGTYPREHGERSRWDLVHKLNTSFCAAIGLDGNPFRNVRRLGTQAIFPVSWGGT